MRHHLSFFLEYIMSLFKRALIQCLPLSIPFIFTACATGGGAKPISLAEMVGTQWGAMTISGMPVVEPGKSTLRFVSEKEVSGSGGCNGFSGAMKMEGGQLKIGPLLATKRGCVGPIQQQESQFLKQLQEARNFKMIGEDMVLVDANGQSLLLLRKM
jgi:heat shock protein HslJ